MEIRKDFSYSHNSDVSAIHSILQYTKLAGISLVEVMGYTSTAFKIIIDMESVEVGSYSHFDWKLHHGKAFQNLGFTVLTAGQQTNIPPTPDELEEGLSLIQGSIDQGVPALSWDIFIPEWGVIYGYDDDRKVLKCRDVRKDDELPYHKLGRGEVTELYVLVVQDYQHVNKREMLKGALRTALEYAHSPLVENESTNYKNGIAAYDAWMEAFKNRSVDPFGNAVNTGKVSDAREFAVQFLIDLAENKDPDLELSSDILQFSKEAAQLYTEVAGKLVNMRNMFPFPHGGEPNREDQAERALTLLSEAKEAEIKGLKLLEEIYQKLA